MIQINYTKEEDDLILNNYELGNKELILSLLPNRNWQSINNRAHKLNIKRKYVNNNVYKLLEDNPISYYWLGYLIADGHFSIVNNIQINIIKSDLNHLLILKKFLDIKNDIKITNNVARLLISDYFNIIKIKEKFSISNNKTYNPVIIPNNTDINLIYCLLIGIIDGDGTFNKKNMCVLTSHKNWKIFFENLNIGKSYVYDNILRYSISYKNVIFLKEIINQYNLPILDRKWKNINLIYKNNKIEHICNLLKNNYTFDDIKSKYNYSRSSLYKALDINNKEDKNYITDKDLFKNKYEYFNNNILKYSKKELIKKLEISIATYNRWKKKLINNY